MKAEILTPWGEQISPDGEVNYIAQLWLDHPNIRTFGDRTGQAPIVVHANPNLFIVWIDCDQTTLDAIEADQTYYVMWSRE